MEHKIPYQVIKRITNNYDKDRILGSGGYGTVYKAVYENGSTVAVKVFDLPRFDDSEFRKEFDNLKRLRHENIVELLGFCNDTEEVVFTDANGKQVPAVKLHSALCLEYVQNGHLGDYISDISKGLHWPTRYKIIKGVCEGLKYLHEGINPRILHLDLKPQNILLDKDMIPKISDFGLARLFGEEKITKTTSTRGTVGYMPPEYTDFHVISEKFDIYSLGVIMVKIITGHDRFFRIGDVSRKVFINQVHDNWRRRLCKNLDLRLLQVYCQQVRRCIGLALDCIKKNPQERPTIQKIISVLMETETMIGHLNIEQILHDETILPKINTLENSSSAQSSESNPSAITRETLLESNLTAMDAPAKELTFDFLLNITHGFSVEQKLGENSFGEVYKGIFGDGQVITVVKFKPDSPIVRDRTFTDKVQSLSTLNHQNIVKILGYCREERRELVDIKGQYMAVESVETLLCHKYFAAGSLADYIDGEPCQLDWDIRFKIILGICQGLYFLHTLPNPIIHTDLKPENIILDNDMEPKIFDFGQSRHFHGGQTRVNTLGAAGSIGYMAPEYLYSGELSTRADIYSLGIMILEIITGQRNHRNRDQKSSRGFIEEVKENWKKDACILAEYPSLDGNDCCAIKKCIDIGLDCVMIDQRKRPPLELILYQLEVNKKEGKYYVIQEEVELLDVQPQELCFPFQPKKNISCSLQLRNNGDDHVAFMLVSENPSRYLSKLPLYGSLPHRCTYTHTITMHKQQDLPSDSGEFFTLHSVAVGKLDLQDLERDSNAEVYRNFFKEAKEVQEVTLTVKCDLPVHQEPTRPTIEIIMSKDAQAVSSIDVHPTEPWVMTATKGSIHVWNYTTMAKLSLFEEDIVETGKHFHVAKFLEREKWIVAGDANGGIHVYSYDEHDEVKFVSAHDSRITSLALHPTRPFLLSSSEDADNLIKLWDWGKNWEGRTFLGHADKVMQVTFNSNRSGYFTSASLDRTVKIWRIDNGDADITLVNKYASLLCIDHFERSNQQLLIAGSMDGTAQIWNMETKEDGCVYQLEGHRGSISAINLHPDLPMLITGSVDGTVRLWNSDTYKLDHIINFNLGQVCAFGFIKDPIRIVVGCQHGIAIMEISMP